eukprot:scaffold58627_cov57-Attheya_sp.AAC.1
MSLLLKEGDTNQLEREIGSRSREAREATGSLRHNTVAFITRKENDSCFIVASHSHARSSYGCHGSS